MYWDVLHSCEFCIQDSQGHISEVKRLAALHMAVDLYLPYLAKLISFACWKFCNQLTVIQPLTYEEKFDCLPLRSNYKTYKYGWKDPMAEYNWAGIFVVVDRGRFFLRSHRLYHNLINSLSFFLSYYSENVITFMIFLTTWRAIIKNMPKFCWFWRKQPFNSVSKIKPIIILSLGKIIYILWKKFII